MAWELMLWSWFVMLLSGAVFYWLGKRHGRQECVDALPVTGDGTMEEEVR